MTENKRLQSKRDLILIVLLLVILGGVFVYFNFFAYNQPAAYAHIYYGNDNEPIATIDFVNETVTYRTQNVPSEYTEQYPIIDLNRATITLLGDYKVDGVRQIVVIEYDFGRRSVEIIEEQSPNNICSLEGLSTGKPLICLPNRVRVEFETSDENGPDFSV